MIDGTDDTARLAAAAGRCASPGLAAALLAHVRPSVALAVETGEVASAGFYGGPARLPAAVPWPEHAGTPMTLLARVDCATVAPLAPGQWSLPRTGWLLFFHDDGFAAEPSPDRSDDGCRVVHVPADAPVRHPPARAGAVPALPLVASAAASLPGFGAPGTKELFRSDPPTALTVRSELAGVLGPTPRHRLLGWAEDEFFDLPGHRPLLQLAAEEGTAWGECVAVSFWLPEADLVTGRLGSARRVCEVA